MTIVDEIIAELLHNTAARGVFLLGGIAITDNQQRNVVLARAVSEPSIKPPARIMIESETYLDIDERQIFADRIGSATLVIVFDGRSSHGLVRLRVRHARDAIARALATPRP